MPEAKGSGSSTGFEDPGSLRYAQEPGFLFGVDFG
jgi:hypothetical protein